MKITKIVQGAYQYLLSCLHFSLTSIKPGIDSQLLFLCTLIENHRSICSDRIDDGINILKENFSSDTLMR